MASPTPASPAEDHVLDEDLSNDWILANEVQKNGGSASRDLSFDQIEYGGHIQQVAVETIGLLRVFPQVAFLLRTAGRVIRRENARGHVYAHLPPTYFESRGVLVAYERWCIRHGRAFEIIPREFAGRLIDELVGLGLLCRGGRDIYTLGRNYSHGIELVNRYVTTLRERGIWSPEDRLAISMRNIRTQRLSEKIESLLGGV